MKWTYNYKQKSDLIVKESHEARLFQVLMFSAILQSFARRKQSAISARVALGPLAMQCVV